MNAHADREKNGDAATAVGAGSGIVHLLVRLRRKVRTILVVRGIFLAAGTALIALLAAIGTDALFAPEVPLLRWAITLSVFAIALVGFALFLIRPAMQKVSIDEIARVLEVRHPELKERLSNALDITRRRKSGKVDGVSAELLASTLKDAEKAAAKIRPGQEFVHHNWWKYGLVAAAPIFVVCALAMFFPDQLGRLFGRVFDPTSERGNVYALRMHVTPGDASVREGDPLIIVLESEHLSTDRAELVRLPVGGEGRETLEAMSLVEQDEVTGQSRFMIKFPAVNEPFEYQVNSGVASSERFRIDVKKWPQLAELKTVMEFPEYTKLERRESIYAGELISAPIGTRVGFEARFTQPLEKAVLQLPDDESLTGVSADGGQVARWEFVMRAGLSGAWHHTATNRSQMETKSEPGQVRAIYDLQPVVQLFEPAVGRVVAKSGGKVKFEFDVRDDFGLGDCTLQVMTDRGARHRIDVDVDFSDPRRTSGEGVHELDLAEVSDSGTRRMIAFMRVWDERPDELGGRQSSDSHAIVIDLDHTSGPLRDPMEDNTVNRLYLHAVKELRKAHGLSEEMHRGLRQGDLWNANKQKLDRLKVQITSAARALGELADEFAKHEDNSSAEIAHEIRTEEVKPAERAVQAIPSQPQKRVQNAEYAEKKLAEAVRRLEMTPLPSDAPPKFDSPLAQMVNLTEQQIRLARLAELQALKDPGKPMDEEWRGQQQALAQAMQQALDQQKNGPP